MAESRRRQPGPITPDGKLPPYMPERREVQFGPENRPANYPKPRKLGDIIRDFQAPENARTSLEAERMALDDLSGGRVSDGPDPTLLRWATNKRRAEQAAEQKRVTRIPRAVQSATSFDPATQAGKNHERLEDMMDAQVTDTPSPQLVEDAQKYRRRVAPRASEQDPSLSKEGQRTAAARQREAARVDDVYGRSYGPSEFSPLAGRKGVADNTPIEQLTPEQRKRRDYQLYQPNVPHVPGSGYHVWDQRLNDGAGGYADRAPDPHLTKGLGPNATLDQRAHAMGIDVGAYSPDTQAQLEADVAAAEDNHFRRAKNFDTQAIPGGGHRWVPNKYTVQQNAAQNAEGFLEHEWAKWQREARADNNGDGKPDMSFQDFKAAYYGDTDKDGVPDPLQPGDPEGHLNRVRRLRGMITSDLSATRSANIQENIENRAKQDNMARRLGVHPGHMVMHGDLMNSRTPEDLIRTMLAYHSINPQQGYGNAAMMVDRNQADMRAAELTAGAAGERNKTGFQKSQEAAAGIPVVSKPEDFQAWRDHYRSQAGTTANPKDEAAHVVRNTTSAARDAVTNINKPGNFEVLQAWTQAFMESNDGDGRKDYDAWLAHLGQHNGPRMRALWERLTGKGIRGPGEWAWEKMFGGEPTAQAGGI